MSSYSLPGYPIEPVFRHVADGIFIWAHCGKFVPRFKGGGLEGVDEEDGEVEGLKYSDSITSLVEEVADSIQIQTGGNMGAFCHRFPLIDSIFSLFFREDPIMRCDTGEMGGGEEKKKEEVELVCVLEVDIYPTSNHPNTSTTTTHTSEHKEEDHDGNMGVSRVVVPQSLVDKFQSLVCHSMPKSLLMGMIGFRNTTGRSMLN